MRTFTKSKLQKTPQFNSVIKNINRVPDKPYKISRHGKVIIFEKKSFDKPAYWQKLLQGFRLKSLVSKDELKRRLG